jgi:hypothetical protein
MHNATDGGSFCEVCREEIIVNICKTVSLIDSFTPANSAAIRNPSGVSLIIRPVKPDSFRIARQWSINGSLLSIASDTLKLADAGLKAGLNTVIVRAIASKPRQSPRFHGSDRFHFPTPSLIMNRLALKNIFNRTQKKNSPGDRFFDGIHEKSGCFLVYLSKKKMVCGFTATLKNY